jgi:hypothetical protein
MSFVRTSLAGEPTASLPAANPTVDAASTADANPIVISTGIPGFQATIPLTTPSRERVAVAAVGGVTLVGFLVAAGIVAYATRKK